MTSMWSSAPSSTWPDPSALSPPGSALTSFEMPPILRIWRFISMKSFSVQVRAHHALGLLLLHFLLLDA